MAANWGQFMQGVRSYLPSNLETQQGLASIESANIENKLNKMKADQAAVSLARLEALRKSLSDYRNKSKGASPVEVASETADLQAEFPEYADEIAKLHEAIKSADPGTVEVAIDNAKRKVAEHIQKDDTDSEEFKAAYAIWATLDPEVKKASKPSTAVEKEKFLLQALGPDAYKQSKMPKSATKSTSATYKPAPTSAVTAELPIFASWEAFKNLEGNAMSSDKSKGKQQAIAARYMLEAEQLLARALAKETGSDLVDMNIVRRAVKKMLEASIVDDFGYNSFDADKFQNELNKLLSGGGNDGPAK